MSPHLRRSLWRAVSVTTALCVVTAVGAFVAAPQHMRDDVIALAKDGNYYPGARTALPVVRSLWFARAAHPDQLDVVVLGDSVAAGTACECEPFADRVAAALNDSDTAPAVTNLALPGSTTEDLLESLTQPAVRARVAEADVVVITAGANDFAYDEVFNPVCEADTAACFGDQLQQTGARLGAAVDDVRSLQRHGAQGRLVVTGYWNLFADGEQASELGAVYKSVSQQLTAVFNAQTQALSARSGALFADTRAAFTAAAPDGFTSLLADDGDHPNEAGHEAIAGAVLKALSANAGHSVVADADSDPGAAGQDHAAGSQPES